jgi:hypothetical protein
MDARSFGVFGGRALRTALVGLATLAAGCGGGGGADTGPVSADAASTVTTDSGTYRVSVHSAPDAAPTRGVNTLQMVVTRVSDGAPADGLALEVVPWMPAMGHGASVKPSVHAEAQPGVFTVANVNLFMPGLWEIRTTIGGSASDHVTPTFEIR